MEKTIAFNTSGYDGFIDFIKIYAIICVLFGHTFLWLDKIAYDIWAGMQVPLFILVQTFHAYKKEKVFVNIWKILKRVFIPFVVIECIVFVISLLGSGFECKVLIVKGLIGGGTAPALIILGYIYRLLCYYPSLGLYSGRVAKLQPLLYSCSFAKV